MVFTLKLGGAGRKIGSAGKKTFRRVSLRNP